MSTEYRILGWAFFGIGCLALAANLFGFGDTGDPFIEGLSVAAALGVGGALLYKASKGDRPAGD